ncbi:MAG: hypothetical protein J0H62_06545 [Rhizobiales bacterium]|nr:hypothetical protein [Hyphomicrobiales bacterium]
MAYAFDTLGYAKRLREAGIDQRQAEAHAEAAREFIMTELVTKGDLNQAIPAVNQSIEHLTLKLSVRLGILLAAGITILGAIQKLGH